MQIWHGTTAGIAGIPLRTADNAFFPKAQRITKRISNLTKPNKNNRFMLLVKNSSFYAYGPGQERRIFFFSFSL
jgi:hypothetical protein